MLKPARGRPLWRLRGYGNAFFLAEMGDKTQIVALALAANTTICSRSSAGTLPSA